MLRIVLLLNCLSCIVPNVAMAWGAEGHKVVGSIADQMLNPNAKQQVAEILGVDLKTAGPWLDCVKSVQRQADGTFLYKENPIFEPPCTPFKDERARMEDYVGRNWFDCSYKSPAVERGCHNALISSTSPSSATASTGITKAPTITTSSLRSMPRSPCCWAGQPCAPAILHS